MNRKPEVVKMEKEIEIRSLRPSEVAFIDDSTLFILDPAKVLEFPVEEQNNQEQEKSKSLNLKRNA